MNEDNSFYLIMVRVTHPETEKYQFYMLMFDDNEIMAFKEESNAFAFLRVPKENECCDGVREYFNMFKPSICRVSGVEEAHGVLDPNPSGTRLMLFQGKRKTVLLLCRPVAEAMWLDGKIYNVGDVYEQVG